MSSSSKKKLRSAAEATKMTERQLQEQKEAKQLKLYTGLFVAVLAVMVVFAAYVGINSAISSSGSRERGTVALTLGEHEISNAELNFYYFDAVNQFYSTYGSMASLFGLDLTKPLNEQYVSGSSETTWADDFLETAKTSAQTVLSLNLEAEKAGFTLSAEELAEIDAAMEDMAHHAKEYGFSSTKDYIKAIYGNGASEELLREYYKDTATANAYQIHYASSLSYTDEDLRAGEADKAQEYNAYSYNVYSVVVDNFLAHEESEDGTTSHDHSAEDRSAAEAEAELVAKALAEGGYTTAEEFDAAIAALPMNAENESAASTQYEDTQYDYVTSIIREWVSSSDRKAGDMTYIPNTSTNDDGTTSISSFYVVLFGSVNDNTFGLDNVRHILVSFEGGTTDDYGTVTYSDDEKAAALAKAEELLSTWQSGDATEESFIELAKAESDDTGSAADGGLISDITPESNLVENFLNWSIDETRKVGDTGIVESTYGYHVMFYSSESQQTYRDYMIENDMRSEDVDAWMEQLLEALPITVLDTSYIQMDLVLSSN